MGFLAQVHEMESLSQAVVASLGKWSHCWFYPEVRENDLSIRFLIWKCKGVMLCYQMPSLRKYEISPLLKSWMLDCYVNWMLKISPRDWATKEMVTRILPGESVSCCLFSLFYSSSVMSWESGTNTVPIVRLPLPPSLQLLGCGGDCNQYLIFFFLMNLLIYYNINAFLIIP